MAPTIRIGIPPGKPKLLDKVRDVIRRKHYSFRTEQTYIDWIRRFILFHGKRHPRDLAEAEVTDFLTSLARRQCSRLDTEPARKTSITCQGQMIVVCTTFMCCVH